METEDRKRMSNASSPANEKQPSGFAIWVEEESAFSPDRLSELKHNFHHHALVQVDQLEALAQRLLPLKQCRFINPGAKQNSAFIHHSESPDGRDHECVGLP